VRSAYHLSKELVERNGGQCSKEEKDQGVWKALWSLEVPNQVKLFMWRAFQNLLPTRADLCRRKVVKEASYPCCGQCDENVLHVLWTCPAAQDVWGRGGGAAGRCSKNGIVHSPVLEGSLRKQ
jgi:hypothetical protein